MKIAKEAVQIIYDDHGVMQLLMVGNGTLKFFRLTPATADDFEDIISAKPVLPGGAGGSSTN